MNNPAYYLGCFIALAVEEIRGIDYYEAFSFLDLIETEDENLQEWLKDLNRHEIVYENRVKIIDEAIEHLKYV